MDIHELLRPRPPCSVGRIDEFPISFVIHLWPLLQCLVCLHLLIPYVNNRQIRWQRGWGAFISSPVGVFTLPLCNWPTDWVKDLSSLSIEGATRPGALGLGFFVHLTYGLLFEVAN